MEIEGIKPEFTCISCRVGFKDGEIQRLHYKTDWHRYNLKRKVAELPPVTSEEFQRRVIAQQQQDEASKSDTATYCKCCRKSFSNEKAFENHLNSKKHNKNADNENEDEIKVKSSNSKQEINMDIEEVDSDEWEDADVDTADCLFCGHHSRNLIKNLTHMSIAHTFFVPDVEYCIDVTGLIGYLAEKVADGFMCLWCNEKGRTFHSADSVRSHMLDKGHCKMLHEGITLAEYAEFYDYSSSYPDAEQIDNDEEVEVPELEGNEYQLVLPSGAIIGHRSLMRYYKQSNDPNRAVVPVQKHSRKLHKVLASYRALGWSPMEQESAAKQARDLHRMKRLHTKLNMQLGVKANKFQKHFRQQVNF